MLPITYSCSNSLPIHVCKLKLTKFCNSASSNKAGFINFRKLVRGMKSPNIIQGWEFFFWEGGRIWKVYTSLTITLRDQCNAGDILPEPEHQYYLSCCPQDCIICMWTAIITMSQLLQFLKLCDMISNYMYVCKLFNDRHNNVRTVVYTIIAYN